MTISVCMGIYQGARYLEEQLLSILHQTRPADEVILCDDGSKDRTVELVREFIREHHLEKKWKLYCNEKNKGYPGNFYYAMSLCSMDVVFLADQDDIWDVHKLERMTPILQERKDVKAVCCKFGLVDASGADIHSIMAPARSRGTGSLRNISIEDVFYKCEWPGMVVAYRGEWYRKRLEVWKQRFMEPDNRESGSAEQDRELSGRNTMPKQGAGPAEHGTAKESYPQGLPHDFLICAWAAEEGAFLQLDEELAYHRRHDANTGGEEHRIARLLNRERKLAEIQNYLKILDIFEECHVLRENRSKQALADKKRVMEQRDEALRSGKISRVLANAWHNRKETRLATAVCDAVIAAKKGG